MLTGPMINEYKVKTFAVNLHGEPPLENFLRGGSPNSKEL
jgi:hypothetical protein